MYVCWAKPWLPDQSSTPPSTQILATSQLPSSPHPALVTEAGSEEDLLEAGKQEHISGSCNSLLLSRGPFDIAVQQGIAPLQCPAHELGSRVRSGHWSWD